MQVGADEAGKGPVLGSMFAAAVRADPDRLPPAVGDSKSIPPEERERLAATIRDVARVAVVEVPVERIDDSEANMNDLTVAAHADAVGAVAAEGDRAYLDAADTNAVRFEKRVEERLEVEISLRARHRADERHPIVGAASILAKVERDAHVENLAAEYGRVGSGYPSDQTTREFLRDYVAEHDRLPACARRSWQTSRDAIAAAEQASLSEFRALPEDS